MVNIAVTDLKSSRASGQIGKASVYYVRKGIQCKRSYVVPIQPDTQDQIDVRNNFKNGMLFWKVQEQSFRNEYNEKVKNPFLKMWGVNLFMSKWLRGLIKMVTIKSIQRGNTVCVGGINDITITAVDVDKSIITVSGYTFDEQSDGLHKLGIVGGILVNSTTLRIFAIKDALASSPRALWQVIEYF